MILPQEWELGKVHTVEGTEISDLKFSLMLSGSMICVLSPSTDPSNCLMRSGRVKLVLGIFTNTAFCIEVGRIRQSDMAWGLINDGFLRHIYAQVAQELEARKQVSLPL
jgi:hypothetical protein